MTVTSGLRAALLAAVVAVSGLVFVSPAAAGHETYDLAQGRGRGATLRGSFELKDDHAPGSSVYRVRARAEDASGAARWSAPVYVCLEGNAVGICATS